MLMEKNPFPYVKFIFWLLKLSDYKHIVCFSRTEKQYVIYSKRDRNEVLPKS